MRKVQIKRRAEIKKILTECNNTLDFTHGKVLEFIKDNKLESNILFGDKLGENKSV